VEGALAIQGTPSSSNLWLENTVTVVVTDGRLTISNAAGAKNNKLDFIAITQIAATPLTASMDFSGGFAPRPELCLNGSAGLNGSVLQLTSGAADQVGSVFSTDELQIKTFSSQFSFQILNPVAEGFTFTIQGTSPLTQGSSGGALGYGPVSATGFGG